jgi:hypothetical protein
MEGLSYQTEDYVLNAEKLLANSHAPLEQSPSNTRSFEKA